ncbi:hypothetical protein MAR_035209 [Mya arenaria]|uniref:Uncharacterized protein n=1 Tax=Mya arenaria TaxID=6604 RepID=A0ABY7END4_MYAAR|nr:hypothetical protein MAR_035209 [Mya arenaria]
MNPGGKEVTTVSALNSLPTSIDGSLFQASGFNRNVNEEEIDGTAVSAQPLDSDIDFDADTTELLAGLDIESLISESPNTVQRPNLSLPEDVKIVEKLISLKFQEPLRENQTVYNHFIQYLLDNNEKLQEFCATQYFHLLEMFNETVKDSKTQKAQTAFFKAFQSHLTSGVYKS